MGKSWRKIDLDKIFTHDLSESISVTQINSALLFSKLPLQGKTKQKQSPQTVPLKMLTFISN